jgi:hypothetical protein
VSRFARARSGAAQRKIRVQPIRIRHPESRGFFDSMCIERIVGGKRAFALRGRRRMADQQQTCAHRRLYVWTVEKVGSVSQFSA